jgi:flagellar hook protein FlgE
MSFQQGLSGLNAAAQSLDVIGNNVSNASTVGFKGSDVLFADMYAKAAMPNGWTGNVGIGTTVGAVQARMAQGNITSTNNPLDVAINGQGFYRMDTNGAVTYSRNGQFHLDSNGYVVNAGNAKLTGYGVNAAGTIIGGAMGPLKIDSADLTPTATTKAAIGLNLDSREAVVTGTLNVNDPKTYNKSTSMTVYDSLGNAHTLATYYTKTAPNAWSVSTALDGTLQTPAAGTLTFKADGSLDTTASTMPLNVAVTLANGAAPLAVALDFGTATQYGSAFGVNDLTQDGYSSGKISGVSIAADGTVQGNYSNGQSRKLGQIVLAQFANAQGLQPLGNNQYGETAVSGQPLVGTPGSGSMGAVQSGAVEESNVDLTKELVDMITAQRVYQANAQTIKTQDQVMSTLVNLR